MPKHFGEVLAEAVRGRALDAAARRWDEGLHRRRVQAAGELLVLGLATHAAEREGGGAHPLIERTNRVGRAVPMPCNGLRAWQQCPHMTGTASMSS